MRAPSHPRRPALAYCSCGEAYRGRRPRSLSSTTSDIGSLESIWAQEWKVGVECDGSQHWLDPAQRTWDIDRWAKLEANGWAIIRVSGELLRYRPDVVVERAIDALRRAGWRGEIRVDARQPLKYAS